MNNDINTALEVHIYRPKRGTLALNVFSLGAMGIVLGIPFIMFFMMLVSFIRVESKLDIFMTVLACLMIPIVILLGFNLIQMTIITILSFFSYVKISPDGIEQKNSLYKHIKCSWADVDKLGKLFLFTDVIYLNSYEVLGFSLSLKSPFRLFRPNQGFISISGYEGWPDGQLANDLKQYASKLFENQPIHQETQTENKKAQLVETALMSQEVRLLAAISHASVLLPNIGFFVPIGIYLTQKKKSSYLGFQALQALIWQFIMILFTMLTSSCLVGSMLIPLLLSTALQDERLLNLSSGGVFIAIVINVLFMTIGSLAFTLYSIIGAVMTYQGKDFRYPFLGNRIEKNKGFK